MPATVLTALGGVSGVVVADPGVPDQEVNGIAGSVRAGVGHVVTVTSEAAEDSPVARRRDRAVVEELFISSGLGLTLARNNAYTQNLLMHAPAIPGTMEFGSWTGDHR